MECCLAPADFATDERRRKQRRTDKEKNSGACRLKKERTNNEE
jgi:hypothetical protein